MKKTLICFCMALCLTAGFGQINKTKVVADPRLQEVFSANELREMSINQSDRISSLNYYLDHACYISTTPEGSVSNIKEVTLRKDLNQFIQETEAQIESKNFNYMKYNFKIHQQKYTSYLLPSGKYLVFYPRNIIEEQFKRSK